MLKKTITFKDLDEKDVTEDFYFNISKAEIAELELSHKGGLSKFLETIVETEDGGEIIRIFKDIIGLSVGVRSEDGRRFIKNDEIRGNFMQTDAYSVLFMELVTDSEKGAEFVRGVMPADLAAQIEAGERVTDLPLPSDKEPAWILENRDPTQAEVREMSKEQLGEAFRRREARKEMEA